MDATASTQGRSQEYYWALGSFMTFWNIFMYFGIYLCILDLYGRTGFIGGIERGNPL